MTPPLKFHHVGVGTRTYDETIEAYEGLGYATLCRADDAGLRVRLALLRSEALGGPLIEVVAPLGDKGPLDSLIKRKVLPTPYHTCYAVPDLDVPTAWLRDQGFMPLGDPAPAVVFGGARMLYFLHRAIGLLELLELRPAGKSEA